MFFIFSTRNLNNLYLHVSVPIQTIELVLVDQFGEETIIDDSNPEFEFDEEVKRDITCRVSGSNPAPHMHMMLGEHCISERFERTVTYELQDSPDNSKLKIPSFEGTMSAEQIRLDNSFARYGFHCKASVGDHEVRRGFRVKLQGGKKSGAESERLYIYARIAFIGLKL